MILLVQGRHKINASTSFIYLVRSSAVSSSEVLDLINADGTLLHTKPLLVYSNPFGSALTLDFELTETQPVTTQIVTLQGKVVYNNYAGNLTPGHYTLPIQTQTIAAGYYTVILKYGKQIKTARVVKL